MTAAPWFRNPAVAHRILRCVLLAGFVWLAGRHWHPYYGFTRFLQMDTASAANTVPELRDAPLFLYDDGYDGHYYAQLAARPAVKDPGLARSIDDVGYRARRILMSWTAWVAGGGDAVAAVRAYSWLNLLWWAGLAALLWLVFPCGDWRGTIAWAGVLFSAGVLHSVRLALTDLLALLFVAGAAVLLSRERRGPAAALLAAGGLARDTVLLGTVMLLPNDRTPRSWFRAMVMVAAVAAPLLLWILYLRLIAGWGGAEPANFAFPLSGWLGKWGEAWSRLRHEPDHWLSLTTLLAQVAITVQAVYLLLRPQPGNPWWRLGLVYLALLIFLGPAVWQGHPGAATRVLLPLLLAFNVLAVSTRAGLGWLIAGNLSVLAGVQVLWTVPQSPHELAAGRVGGGAYVVHTDRHWYPAEYFRNRTWAWAQNDGQVRVDFHSASNDPKTLRLEVKGITARPLEILQDGRVLWSGVITPKMESIVLPSVPVLHDRIELELRSPSPAVKEGPGETDRALGFAVYGLRVD